MKEQSNNTLDSDSIKIIEARHHDPFSVLGRHPHEKGVKVKVYLPYAESVSFANGGAEIPRITGTDFFEYTAKQNELPEHYQLAWIDKDGGEHSHYDPYDFGVQ
ncbi:MAG: GlgB N-terminal domain-containing protein, partial [Methylococcaceae bacterium]